MPRLKTLSVAALLTAGSACAPSTPSASNPKTPALEDEAMAARCNGPDGRRDPRCPSVQRERPQRPAGARIHGLEDGTATLLCRGSVVSTPAGSPARIEWAAYVSASPPAAVVRDTTAALEAEPVTDSRGCASWRIEGDRSLSVCPATAAGPWTECPESVPSDAQSIILSSSLLRLGPPESR